MFQRIDASSRDIRVGGKVPLGVEAKAWITALLPSISLEVLQRVDAGKLDIPVGSEIPGRVEERIRVPPLLPA